MLKEFKAFIFKGNIVDLAVGVIIGTAFSAIISSFVADIITPLLLNPALEMANVKDLADLKWHGAAYGKFLSSVISFVVIAFVLFMLLKGVNKAMKAKPEEPAAPEAPSNQEVLLTEIRDLLKK
jgi:large conductance mechanosensitive channel